jgi:hypothetical protein
MSTSQTFAARALHFYQTLRSPIGLPDGVAVMNPYEDPAVQELVSTFLTKFFSDTQERVLVFGINPGRFGSGTTGVTFTDPVALQEYCGIPNDLSKVRELSSVFVYQCIEAWGGSKKFYRDFFMTAVSPLGFLRSGRNYNYYDDPRLMAAVRPFILETLEVQLALGARRHAAIIFGTGKNKKFFEELNRERGFFETIYALEHPRFIMQYRRRQIDEYVQKYQEVFAKALE